MKKLLLVVSLSLALTGGLLTGYYTQPSLAAKTEVGPCCDVCQGENPCKCTAHSSPKKYCRTYTCTSEFGDAECTGDTETVCCLPSRK